MANNSVKFCLILSINSASINNTNYTVIGQLSNLVQGITLTNNSSTDIMVSFDGVLDNIFLPTKTSRQYDFQVNRAAINYVVGVTPDTQFYAKGTAGTGLLYIEGYYF